MTAKKKKTKSRTVKTRKAAAVSGELEKEEFRERCFNEILGKTIEHPKPIKGYESTLPKAFGEEFKYHVPFDLTRGQRIFPAKNKKSK